MLAPARWRCSGANSATEDGNVGGGPAESPPLRECDGALSLLLSHFQPMWSEKT